MPQSLTARDVRKMLLAAQGLTSPLPEQAAKDDVLAAIRRMHYVQIDTISVVARSPYLVLWSRVGDYEPRWLDELLADGSLFEYWSHAACMLPTEHFGLYRGVIRHASPGRLDRSQAWLHANAELVEKVRGRIREEGPLRSADFERTDGRKGNGWWDWKEEKLALERMFNVGELMVARRQSFQRLYDLRERVRPEWDDESTPAIEEARAGLVLAGVRALGVGRADWVQNYLYTVAETRAATQKRLDALTARNLLIPVEMEATKLRCYVHPDNAGLLESVGDLAPRKELSLLSPFDPVVSDRKRGLELFGFDYTIECYTPEPKRRYGYFTLPILRGDEVIGRVDAKAHRKAGVFEVRALHLEPGVVVSAELVDGLRDVFRRCAAWHGTPEVVVRVSDPAGLAAALAG